jgi:hypothetical protein
VEVLILKGLAVPGFAVDGEAVVVVEVQSAGFWVEVLLRGLKGGFGRVGGLRGWGSRWSGLGCGSGAGLVGGWCGGGLRGAGWSRRWGGRGRDG